MKFKIDYFLHRVLLLLVLGGFNGAFVSATTNSEIIYTTGTEQEEEVLVVCHATDESCSAQQKMNLYTQDTSPPSAQGSSQCKLYVAESSIPNAGLGLYSSSVLPLAAGSELDVPELVLTHIDLAINCKMSKLFTEKEAKQWKDVVGTKVDNRDDHKCALYVLQGECELNPAFMMNMCAKSCAIHNAGLDVKKGFIRMKDKRSECEAWAKAGECTNHRTFMIQSCPYSFIMEEYDILPYFDTFVITWPLRNYYWDWEGSAIGIYNEASRTESILVPGAGAILNCHPGLVNLLIGKHSVDNAGYHRSKDAGVGAYSNRHNMKFITERDVPAGMELFTEYGGGYFLTRESTYGTVPFKDDYKKADKILQDFWKKKTVQQADDDNKAAALYAETLNKVNDVRIKAALPDSYELLKQAKYNDTAIMSVPNVIRSTDWLEENGMCVDLLRAGKSTIPQAGRGAFATRLIMEGALITPMPLLRMGKDKLRRFKGMIEITPQLSVNYSYGHPKSSMLLLPYAPVVNFVNNHLDKSKVNARIRWSTSIHEHHLKDWENDSVEDILSRDHNGLMLEMVATKDIEQGDEVFLDYGSRWDKAWTTYVENWSPPVNSHDFQTVKELNANNVVRTIEELQEKPYGYNVKTFCRLDVGLFFNDAYRKGGKVFFRWDDYSVDKDDTERDENFKVFECAVDRRYDDADEEGEYLYVVILTFHANNTKKDLFVKDTPRWAIEFVSDEFLDNAFRHAIDIPDDIFPAMWRNIDD